MKFFRLFFLSNKQIWLIRQLHLATSALVAQNATWYWILQRYGNSKAMLFYLRHTLRRCCGSIGSLKWFICLLWCAPNSADDSWNCPRSHPEIWFSLYCWIKPSCENWMNSESQFLLSSLEKSRAAHHHFLWMNLLPPPADLSACTSFHLRNWEFYVVF